MMVPLVNVNSHGTIINLIGFTYIYNNLVNVIFRAKKV